MKHRKFIIPIFLFFTFLLFSSGIGAFGMWLFSQDSNEATLQYHPDIQGDDDIIAMDDIAENYYFAADLDALDVYTVYFFCTTRFSKSNQQHRKSRSCRANHSRW